MNEMFSQGGKGSTGILTNKQAIARRFGVKQSEVVYFSVGVDLGGYKVIYDKETQRSYSLPADIAPGTTAISLGTNAVLVHSAGSVDLGELAVSREEYVTLSGSFTTGVTVNTKNELVVFTDSKYRWDGTLPKQVPAGSTPQSTGGIGKGAWVSVVRGVVVPQLSEELKRSYARSGLNLVGDFNAGAVIQNVSEALLDTRTGKVYTVSSSASFPLSVVAGTNPEASPDLYLEATAITSKHYIDPTDYGILPGNTAAVNSTRLKALIEQVNTSGGIIKFPAGTYNVGDISSNWKTVGVWTNALARGIEGAGPGLTTLVVSAPASGNDIFTGGGYWMSFKDISFILDTWVHTSDYTSSSFGSTVNLFNMLTVGSPRLTLSNVRAVGFNMAFGFWTWVSVIEHCEAQQCRYAFVFNKGTSITANSLYAQDSWYAYIIGATPSNFITDPKSDSSMIRGGLYYSTLQNCACDRTVKAGYTVGEYEGSLISCGSEIPYETAANIHRGIVDYPPLVDSAGSPSVITMDSDTIIQEMHVLSNLTVFHTGAGIVNIRRNNPTVHIQGLVSRSGNAGAGLINILTFDNAVTTCNVTVDGRLQSLYGRSISFGALYGSTIQRRWHGEAVLTCDSISTYLGYNTPLMNFGFTNHALKGNGKLRFALTGTSNVNSRALIHCTIGDLTSQASLFNFLGTVTIRAVYTAASPNDPNLTFAQAYINGNQSSEVSVAIEDSTRNAGGKDVVLTFSSNSGVYLRSYSVQAEVTTGARWVDGSAPKYLAWVEQAQE